MSRYLRLFPGLKLAAAPILVPGGERAKRDPKCLDELYQAIEAACLGVCDSVVAVGGCSLLDLADPTFKESYRCRWRFSTTPRSCNP